MNTNMIGEIIMLEKHYRLMIPGPTEIDTQTQLAMAQPTIVHYGEDWGKMNARVLNKLQQVFQTSNDMYIIPGSASAAMEASVTSIIEQDTEILVELSGMFGMRFAEIAKGCGAKVIPLKVEFGKAVDPQVVREMLKANPKIKAMTLVHNESSTGVMNPAAEIAAVCHEFGVMLVCDCVSSMGGVDIRTDEWDLDYCITGAQKCLQSSPGLGILTLAPNAWKKIDERSIPIHGWFLNLSNIREYCVKWSDWHGHGPVTAPTALYAGLEASLDIILTEGLQNRFARHILNKTAVRTSMLASGLKLLVDDSVASNTVTTIIIPEGLQEKQVIAAMKKQYNTLITGTPGNLGTPVLRIGHMGLTADKNFIIPTVAGFLSVCKRMGAKVDIKNGIDALMNVYETQ
jgi:aspartate aminotransferase-like enzyme